MSFSSFCFFLLILFLVFGNSCYFSFEFFIFFIFIFYLPELLFLGDIDFVSLQFLMKLLWLLEMNFKRWRLVFWNSIHLEVASDSFCFLLYSSWLLVFILYVFELFFFEDYIFLSSSCYSRENDPRLFDPHGRTQVASKLISGSLLSHIQIMP